MPDPTRDPQLDGVPKVPEDLMAAIDTAIAEPAPAPGPDVTADPPTHGQDPSDAPPDKDVPDSPASTTPDPDAPPPDSAPATPEDEKPKDPAVTDPADPPPPGARPSDEFKLEGDVKPATKERFEALKTRFDEVHAARDAAEDKVNQWVSIIESTGANPEQFATTINVLRDLNSGDPARLGRAYDALLGQVAEIAKVLGREVPGVVDPLADFPDLQARLDPENDEPISRKDALEIAQARKLQQHQQARAQATETNDTAAQAHARGLQEVRSLGAQFKAANPVEFAAKLPLLTPLIDRVVANLPPAEWTAAITEAYNAIALPAAAPPAPLPRVPAPVRPSGSPGAGFDKKPGSALEAVDLALSRG